ncbi:MAG: cytochrome C peroxidase [Opitutae bacterium]|nr:cytochrome C peroxidase [Opitutae bacterium]
MRYFRFLLVLLGIGCVSLHAFTPRETFRRPIALAWTEAGLLAVANRDSGSVSLINPSTRQVVGESVVGKRLASIASLPNGPFLVSVDEQANELLLLESVDAKVRVRARAATPHSPVDVKVVGDGSFVAVASLWARRVTLFSIQLDSPELRQVRVLDLPFPPRFQWVDPSSRKLVLTDAFSDQVAAVELPGLRLVSTRSLTGHNLGGIAPSPNGKELLFSLQSLNPHVPATRSRVFWGSMMQNGLVAVTLADLFDSRYPAGASFPRMRQYPVGRNGQGAGEPGPMLFARDGSFLLGIRGTGEIAMGKNLNADWKRIRVGERPIAGIFDANEKHVYFADLFGDAIRVIDVEKGTFSGSLSLGPTPKPGLVQMGEALFHNSRLSLDGWYSCNSCHTSGHTSGMLNDNFDDFSFGTPKRIPSLLGTAETGPWTWNGLQGSLTLQVRQSLATTLLNGERKHGHATHLDQEALVSYLFTLPLPPPLSEARMEPPNDLVTKGKLLFSKLGCNECHRQPLLTSPDEYDVGLHDEAGVKEFNPPSLHGVSQRDRFFHDGSARSFTEVLDRFGHPDGGNLTRKQLDQLIAYLRTL